MPTKTSPQSLDALLKGNSPFALIDVRETGEYNNAHIPGASLIPRRDLEAQIAAAVPHPATPVVLCDDDARRATLAAATLERLGYSDVSALDGGINRWVTREYPTEWGVNVPSKDFGEKVEVVHHVPEIDAVELRERIESGEEIVILDTRTPEEYRRLCIPGGRSVPGAELALRITDITKDLSDDATVVINCAGRTRSIIGTRVLQRMGMPNVVGLKNGTAGWSLAGYALEAGADRLELPDLSEDGIAAAEAYADRLADEDGVQIHRRRRLAGAHGAPLQRNRLSGRCANRRGIRRRPTSPASAGSRAVRRCSVPTKSPSSRTAPSYSAATDGRAPPSPHRGIGKWDIRMYMPCMAAQPNGSAQATHLNTDIPGHSPSDWKKREARCVCLPPPMCLPRPMLPQPW